MTAERTAEVFEFPRGGASNPFETDGALALQYPIDEIDPLLACEEMSLAPHDDWIVHEGGQSETTSRPTSRLRQIHPMDVLIISGFFAVFYFI